MNSYKEWTDAGSGNLSQNVEINKSLNFEQICINFTHLYILRYCDLSERMSLDLSSIVLLLVFVMRFGLGMLSMNIHETMKILNFEDIVNSLWKHRNFEKLKTLQKHSGSNPAPSYKCIW